MAAHQDHVVFRSRYGILLCSVVAVFIVLAFAMTFAEGRSDAALRTLPADLAVIWVGWLVFGSPRIRLEDEDLVLVNVVRSVRIPWSAVSGVEPQMMLTVYVGADKYKAWAAPGGSQAGSLGMAASDERIRLNTLSTGGDEAFIRSLSADQSSRGSDAIAATDLVRAAWKTYQSAHTTTTAKAAVTVSFNTRNLYVLSGLILTAIVVGLFA